MPLSNQNKVTKANTHSDLQKLLKICSSCTNCREKCPTYQLKPIEEHFAGGRIRVLRAYTENNLPIDQHLQDNSFFCTTCKSCEIDCPVDFSYVEYLENIRKFINSKIGSIPDKLKLIIESIQNNDNPYGEPKSDRVKWIPKNLSASNNAPIAFFAGCTSSYRDLESATNCAQVLLKILSGNIQLVGEDEFCCGSVLFRTGAEETDVFSLKKYIQEKVELIKKKQIKSLVFSCSGCFKTISQDWPRILNQSLPFEVIHITQFIAENINKIDFQCKPPSNTKKVIYHDPCHLGRHMGVYNEPRLILKSFPNIQLKEFDQNRECAVCCGAGGGFRALYPIEAIMISENRIKEAIAYGCEEIITSCVFCKMNLQAAVKSMKTPLRIKNIEDIVSEYF